LARVGAAEIAEIEPAARGLSALHSPTTAVTDFAAIAEAFAEDFEAAGGTIHLSTPVSKGLPVECGKAVFCAGLQSDRLAHARGGSSEPRIVPIRGGYLKVRAERADLVRGNVYPVPDPALPFLGAHLTRTLDGALLIGPTAMIAGARDAYKVSKLRRRDLGETLRWPGTWALTRRHWRASFDEAANSLRPARLARQAARMVPGLAAADVVPGPAGVRAQALNRRGNLVEDFVIERIGDDVHVRNAPSPAATSSLALAELVADEALK
jgi:2-hydroxyglutarate dehydrogenase